MSARGCEDCEGEPGMWAVWGEFLSQENPQETDSGTAPSRSSNCSRRPRRGRCIILIYFDYILIILIQLMRFQYFCAPN